MRGKRNRGRYYPPLRRITPADAGKTPCRRLGPSHRRDHPRGCGENWAWRGLALTPAGSPPQVRGKHCRIISSLDVSRITPAGAGKTGAGLSGQRQPEDHPRRCGENWSFVMVGFVPLGSPPQVRGKRKRESLLADISRITPAGAGKTCDAKYNFPKI